MKRKRKKVVTLGATAILVSCLTVIPAGNGVHAASETVAVTTTNTSAASSTSTSTSSSSSSSCASSSQATLATKQAAIRAAHAQVESDQEKINRIKGELVTQPSDSDEALALTQSLNTAKQTLASDQVTLSVLQQDLKEMQTAASSSSASGQTCSATSDTAVSTATSQSATANKTVTATPTTSTSTSSQPVQATQSHAAARANGYRIVDDRVVDDKGQIVSGWKVKQGVAYDQKGNQITLKTDATPTISTAKVQLKTPTTAKGPEKPVNRSPWHLNWQAVRHQFLRWLNLA